MNKIIATIVILILFGCNSDNKIPDFSSEIEYKFKTIEYFGNPEKNDIISYKYFNKDGKLIEQIGNEYRIKYSYDSNGKLKEKLNCRIYNCDLGWSEVLKYDDNGNYIGINIIPKKNKSIIPKKFEQTKFYDNKNNLVKELSDSGTDVKGNNWEKWKYYYYENNRIVREIEKSNDEVIWNGEYEYDANNNLVSIKRKNNQKYETESFQYDKQKKLIKKRIQNDELLADTVSFSVYNNSTTYEYDKQGRLIQEITFNHKGKEHKRFVYKYEVKK